MLKGKTALVTGSTSGIGLAIARALAQAGANIMLNGFGDKAAIEKERAGLEKEFGIKALYSPADMTKPAEIAAMIGETEKNFGSLDVLVNNAGIQHVANIEDFPIDKWDADHRHQPVVVVPHHPRRRARHEEAEMGPHHQHRFGARPGRQRAEGCLRRGQARPGRPDQGGGDRDRQCRHHLQRHLPGLGAHAAGAEADRRPRQGVRPDRCARRRSRCCRRSSRCTSSPSRRASARSPCSCAATPPPPSPARPIRSTAAGSRSAAMIEFLARAFGGDKPAPPKRQETHQSRRCKAAARYGAFTWGVLDHLLEDGRLEIEGISGASAGAVNAIMLADGLARGGPDEARKRLADFWRAASLGGNLPRRATPRGRPPVLVRAARRHADGHLVPGDVALSFALRVNPLNINPLKDLIERFVDFDAVRASADLQLFVSATNVQTGQLRVFTRDEMTADMIVASACLPNLFRAVEIDGVPYWDGGYRRQSSALPADRRHADREPFAGADQSAQAQGSAEDQPGDFGAGQRDHVQFVTDGGIARLRLRRAIDRRGQIAARNEAGRIPAHQFPSHRA